MIIQKGIVYQYHSTTWQPGLTLHILALSDPVDSYRFSGKVLKVLNPCQDGNSFPQLVERTQLWTTKEGCWTICSCEYFTL